MAGSSGFIVMMMQMQRERYMRAFAKQSALTPTTAKTLAEAGEQGGYVFRQMVRQGIFVEVPGSGKYYLDQQKVEQHHSRRRGVALVVMGVLVIVVVLCAMLG